VVQEVHAATQQILVQAYSFTSAPIAKALVDAQKRGVKVLAVLDKSNETQQYSAATFLVNAGIQTLIDD
jgi:phosphatidylserine/phosphatidylglycerophosphate/cardiolipin synthase-like enzyme